MGKVASCTRFCVEGVRVEGREARVFILLYSHCQLASLPHVHGVIIVCDTGGSVCGVYLARPGVAFP